MQQGVQGRRGSTVSDKQLEWSVLKGRPIHARIRGNSIYGYVFGVDDYSIALVPVKETPDVSLDGVDESPEDERIVLLQKSRVDILSVYQKRHLESESPEVQAMVQTYTGKYKEFLEKQKGNNRGANSK